MSLESLFKIVCIGYLWFTMSIVAPPSIAQGPVPQSDPLDSLKDIIEPEPLAAGPNYLLIFASLCILVFLVWTWWYRQRTKRRSLRKKLIEQFQVEAHRYASDEALTDSSKAQSLGAAFKVALMNLQRLKNNPTARKASAQPVYPGVANATNIRMDVMSYSQIAELYRQAAQHDKKTVHSDQLRVLQKLDDRFDPSFALNKTERAQLPVALTRLLEIFSADNFDDTGDSIA